jgi:hypothetical protein
MRTLIFDTGPIISLATNNLLWILAPMKDKFDGEFYITEAVKLECVNKPLTSKKFKYEALQVDKLIEDGIIKVYSDEKLKDMATTLLNSANSLFKVHDSYVKIVQYAEIETVCAAKILNSEAIVVDEFITRTLIDEPLSAGKRLEKRLHENVDADKKNIASFRHQVAGIMVIRSLELVTVGFESGLFKDYYLNLPEPKKTLLEGLLWALKLNGCSVSEEEISEVIKAEKF